MTNLLRALFIAATTFLAATNSAQAHQYFEETDCESAKETSAHLLKRETLNHRFTQPIISDVQLINDATEKAVKKARAEALRSAKEDCYRWYARCQEVEFSIQKVKTDDIESEVQESNKGLELHVKKTAEVTANVKVVVRGTDTPEKELPQKQLIAPPVRVSYYPEID